MRDGDLATHVVGKPLLKLLLTRSILGVLNSKLLSDDAVRGSFSLENGMQIGSPSHSHDHNNPNDYHGNNQPAPFSYVCHRHEPRANICALPRPAFLVRPSKFHDAQCESCRASKFTCRSREAGPSLPLPYSRPLLMGACVDFMGTLKEACIFLDTGIQRQLLERGTAIQDMNLVLLSDLITDSSGCPYFLLDIAIRGMEEIVHDLESKSSNHFMEAFDQHELGTILMRCSLNIQTVIFHLKKKAAFVISDKGRKEIFQQLQRLVHSLGSYRKNGAMQESHVYQTPRHGIQIHATATAVPIVHNHSELNSVVDESILKTAAGSDVLNVFHWALLCLRELRDPHARGST